jgi:hypothetical protein
MISGARRQRVAIVIAIALAVGIGLGLRSDDPRRADPTAEVARVRSLAAAAASADQAVRRLSAALAEVLDHARLGAALTVAGSAAPAPELTRAADRLVAVSGEADAVRRSLTAVSGTAAAVEPRSVVPALGYDTSELLLTASQLRDSAEASALFVERRHATEAIVQALSNALAALKANHPGQAFSDLLDARAPMTLLGAWTNRPPLMQYWMTTVSDLLEATRQIALATLDGDKAAVAAAAARYAAASKAARGADNALSVSLAEEGAAVSGGPLRRLAAAVGQAADLHAALQPLMRWGS